MDAAQVKRACASLLGYLRQREEAAAAKRGGAKKSSLFEAGDVLAAEAIQLVVGLKRTPEQGRSKPIRVPIPHSLYAAEDGASLCMFVKDNSEELQARLRKEPVAGLERVVSLSALRRNYKQFADRRKLVAAHDLFVADDRITPMLTKALGKTFLNKKKQPVAVRLTRGSLRKNIEVARDSTYLFLGWGACSTVKIARTDFPLDKVFENCMAAIEGIVAKVPRRWKNIQSIHIKSVDSVALPIFNALPEAERQEIANAKKAKAAVEGGEEGAAVAEATATTTNKKTAVTKKKRKQGSGRADREAADAGRTAKKQKKKMQKKVAVSERFALLEEASASQENKSKTKKKKTKK
jgi:ribosome biogenesis protein UTP30